MANEFLQGLSIGAGIGQGIARNRLAQQQFKSVEAERVMRERLLAAQAAKYAAEVQRQQAMDEEAKQAFDRWSLLQEFGSPEEKSQFQQDTLFGQAIRTGDPRFLRQNQREFQHQALIEDINRLEADGDYDTAAALRAQLQAAQTRASQGGKRIEQAGQRIEQSQKRLLSQEQRDALRLEYQRLGLTIRQIDQAMKLAESGFVVDTPPAPIQGQAPQRVPTDEEILGPEPGAPPTTEGVTLRRVAPALTQANRTAAQNTLNNAVTSTQRIGSIIPHINAKTVGPLATAESILVDRTLSNIFPELLNKERVSVNTMLQLQASETARALKSDGNIAEPERRQLLSQVPTPEQITTSPVRALEQLKTLNREIAQRARNAAKLLNSPLPEELLTPGEIRTMLKANEITEAQAVQMISRSPFYTSPDDLKD